jgi:hypothetical protein
MPPIPTTAKTHQTRSILLRGRRGIQSPISLRSSCEPCRACIPRSIRRGALSCSDALYLNDATLPTANTVDGLDPEPAVGKKPGHQQLSHRVPLFDGACWSFGCAPFFAPSIVGKRKGVRLRPSGDSGRYAPCCDLQDTRCVSACAAATCIRRYRTNACRSASTVSCHAARSAASLYSIWWPRRVRGLSRRELNA